MSGTFAVGGNHHTKPVGQQGTQSLREFFAVTDHRSPSAGVDHRRVGAFGYGTDRPHRLTACQQAIGLGMQSRKGSIRIACPCAGERTRKVVLFSEQIVGAIAHSARLDERDLGRARQHVGDQLLVL